MPAPMFPANALRYAPYRTFNFQVVILGKVVAGLSKIGALKNPPRLSTGAPPMPLAVRFPAVSPRSLTGRVELALADAYDLSVSLADTSRSGSPDAFPVVEVDTSLGPRRSEVPNGITERALANATPEDAPRVLAASSGLGSEASVQAKLFNPSDLGLIDPLSFALPAPATLRDQVYILLRLVDLKERLAGRSKTVRTRPKGAITQPNVTERQGRASNFGLIGGSDNNAIGDNADQFPAIATYKPSHKRVSLDWVCAARTLISGVIGSYDGSAGYAVPLEKGLPTGSQPKHADANSHSRCDPIWAARRWRNMRATTSPETSPGPRANCGPDPAGAAPTHPRTCRYRAGGL